LRRAAKVRLENPRDLEPLPRHDDELLNRLALRLAHEDRYRYGSTLASRAWATHAIAAVLLAVLALEEAVGGSTERNVLEKLGALSVDRVVYDGELWRLVAPLFLHFGVAHAVFNLLGLYVLGPFVERALGWQRFVVVYLLSGLAGTGLYVVRARLFSPDEPLPLLVGASGCVMGLLGATVAILARGALRERAPSARRRLVVLGAVLVVQTIFDLSVENISAFAHLVGALAGLVLGLLLTAGARRS
jgi:rhomboid protease GluP